MRPVKITQPSLLLEAVFRRPEATPPKLNLTATIQIKLQDEIQIKKSFQLRFTPTPSLLELETIIATAARQFKNYLFTELLALVHSADDRRHVGDGCPIQAVTTKQRALLQYMVD